MEFILGISQSSAIENIIWILHLTILHFLRLAHTPPLIHMNNESLSSFRILFTLNVLFSWIDWQNYCCPLSSFGEGGADHVCSLNLIWIVLGQNLHLKWLLEIIVWILARHLEWVDWQTITWIQLILICNDRRDHGRQWIGTISILICWRVIVEYLSCVCSCSISILCRTKWRWDVKLLAIALARQ